MAPTTSRASRLRADPLLTRLLVFAVLVLCCVPLFVGLGRADLRGDEPIYSYAVDQMLRNGDWMTPRYIPQQTPFVEKPPLKFWIIAAGIRSRVLPDNEFGHRFWDALFGALSFLYVFAMARRLAGPAAGAAAALVLFAQQSLLFHHGVRENTMEAPLVLAYCGGIYHALVWSETTSAKARVWHPLAVGLYFTLGFMTKFAAVAFLPLTLAIIAIAFPSWRRRALDDWRAWGVAALVSLAVIVPWFAYQTVELGWELWRVILAEHVVQRMRVSIHPEHIAPWHFYWVRLYNETTMNSTAPLIAVGVVLLACHTVRRRWPAGALMLLWFVLPLAVISAGRAKLYHYAYPFLPPLAIAAGYAAVVVFDSADRALARWQGAATRLSARVDSIGIARRAGLRHTAVAIAVVAFAVAVWTAVHGRFGIRAGDTTIFRNRSVIRPMFISAVLLSLAGRTRDAVRMALALLVIAPVGGYLAALGHLNDGRPTLQQLRSCLQQQFLADGPPRVYGHGDPGQWRYVYYFLPIGWSNPSPPDEGRLMRSLSAPDQFEPVLITEEAYARFRHAHDFSGDVPAVHFDDRRLLLLPGRFGACSTID